MADLQFDKIIKELQAIHEKFPDMKFGQVVQNSMDFHRKNTNINLNDRSSKDIFAALVNFTAHHERKRANVLKNGGLKQG